jgi:hypothetical protein
MAYEKVKVQEYKKIGGINSKISPYNTDQTECLNIENMNFFVPGSLNKRPGTSLYIGATIAGSINGIYEFEKLNGSSYIIATANTNAYSVSGSYSSIKSGLLNGGIFDFVTFVDRLFMCNGQDFFKFDGVNSSNYSLPSGSTLSGFTAYGGGGLSGIFLVGYGYINDRGYVGPSSSGVTISLNGVSYGSISYYGLTTPTGYGISSISFYRSTPGGLNMAGTTSVAAGTASFIDTGAALGTVPANFNLFFTLAPKYMEIYQNMMFLSGASATPSTAYWSEIGEPEGIDPTNFAEFRTNDGDIITGMKAYSGALIVSKERSLHRVVGDTPDNLSIQDITDQYGCINGRTMVVFENLLWFMDRGKIIEFNGANLQIVSTQIEPVLLSMNVDAAKSTAWGLHVKQYNEVWFCFPTNSSQTNDTIAVYDYLIKAWTIYKGVYPSCATIAKGTTPSKNVLFGGYAGSIGFFGSTFYSDFGSGFTCLIDTGFKQPMGYSVEEMYRRFFLNVEPVTGVTQPINVVIKSNYSSTTQISRTMYQNPFQSRIDFGVSAKSIAANIYHYSASLPFRVHGWTFEGRYQRSV